MELFYWWLIPNLLGIETTIKKRERLRPTPMHQNYVAKRRNFGASGICPNYSYFYPKFTFMTKIEWKTAIEFEDITYKKANGVARIAFNRPEVRNAFRPKTTSELYRAFYDAQEDPSIVVVLLSAEGPSPKDGVYSFCSGGDQKTRGHQGYVGEDGAHRLNILEVQRLIRFMPKVVIAVVPGWAVGGGHSLHVVCDLTLASKEHAIFKLLKNYMKMKLLNLRLVITSYIARTELSKS